MTDYSGRIRATVSLRAIEQNYRAIRELIGPGCEALCVVKADAYGHGAVPVAARLEAAGARRFAVATVDEALELREGGITGEILILGSTPPAGLDAAAKADLCLSVTSEEAARAVSEAAVRAGKTLCIHLQADTGMGRLGFDATRHADLNATVDTILRLSRFPGIRVEGLYTHLSDADRPEGAEYTERQFALFCALADALKAKGLSIPLLHCANSAATLCRPEMRLTLCRPGICLYGGYPDSDAESPMRSILSLSPAMELTASVIHVHDVEEGGFVSYGRNYRAPSPRRVAVVAAGYADGVHRALSDRGHVLIRGHRVPIVGRVCMDMFMADVTDVPGVVPGDEAVLFGRQQQACLPVEEQAAAAGTISYELWCAVSKRVPRRYI